MLLRGGPTESPKTPVCMAKRASSGMIFIFRFPTGWIRVPRPKMTKILLKSFSNAPDRGISKCADAAMRAVLYQWALSPLTRSKKFGIAKRRDLRRAALQSHANLPCRCTVFGLTAQNSAGDHRVNLVD